MYIFFKLNKNLYVGEITWKTQINLTNYNKQVLLIGGKRIQLYVNISKYGMHSLPCFENYNKGCTQFTATSDKSLPVACPWSVVLSGYSGFFHH